MHRVPDLVLFTPCLTCPVQLCLQKTAYALFIPQYAIPVLNMICTRDVVLRISHCRQRSPPSIRKRNHSIYTIALTSHLGSLPSHSPPAPPPSIPFPRPSVPLPSSSPDTTAPPPGPRQTAKSPTSSSYGTASRRRIPSPAHAAPAAASTARRGNHGARYAAPRCR